MHVQRTTSRVLITIAAAKKAIIITHSECVSVAWVIHLNEGITKCLDTYYNINILRPKTKSMVMYGNHIKRVQTVINDNIIEQVTDFKYLGYRISEHKSDLEYKL